MTNLEKINFLNQEIVNAKLRISQEYDKKTNYKAKLRNAKLSANMKSYLNTLCNKADAVILANEDKVRQYYILIAKLRECEYRNKIKSYSLTDNCNCNKKVGSFENCSNTFEDDSFE